MDSKRFKMIDEEFICDVCGEKVRKLEYTARDHCPYCLSSKHLDINPGDRLSECRGILKPVDIEKGKKDIYKIIYQCTKCKEIRKNKVAMDDNFDKILEIMSRESK